MKMSHAILILTDFCITRSLYLSIETRRRRLTFITILPKYLPKELVLFDVLAMGGQIESAILLQMQNEILCKFIFLGNRKWVIF